VVWAVTLDGCFYAYDWGKRAIWGGPWWQASVHETREAAERKAASIVLADPSLLGHIEVVRLKRSQHQVNDAEIVGL
jgi:hypothetical protein